MIIHHEKKMRDIIGSLGNVISFVMFVSPIPTFVQIYRRKEVQDFSPIPYLTSVLNCAIWILYGMPFVHPNSILVVTINCIGLVFESFYLSSFFFYSTRESQLKMAKIFCAEVVLFVAIAVGVLLGTHTHERRTLIIGIFCIIFNICMYAAPLGVMKMVIQTKSVEYMPFFLALASFLNGACWTAYGCLPLDVNIVIPNAIGTFFGLVQLILYAFFFRSNPNENHQPRDLRSEDEIHSSA